MKMGRYTFQCWMRALHLSFEPWAMVVMLVLISYSEGWPKFLRCLTGLTTKLGKSNVCKCTLQQTNSVLFHWTLSLLFGWFMTKFQCIMYIVHCTTTTDKVDDGTFWWSSTLCVCNKTSSTMCNKTRQDSWWWSDKVRIWHQVTEAAQRVTRQEFRLLTASWNLTCARSNLC